MAPCGPYSMLELACQGAQRGLDFVSVLRVCALASGARGCCWRACVHACVRVCIPVALVCVRERKQMATRASHACTLVQPGPCSAPGPDVARLLTSDAVSVSGERGQCTGVTALEHWEEI